MTPHTLTISLVLCTLVASCVGQGYLGTGLDPGVLPIYQPDQRLGRDDAQTQSRTQVQDSQDSAVLQPVDNTPQNQPGDQDDQILTDNQTTPRLVTSSTLAPTRRQGAARRPQTGVQRPQDSAQSGFPTGSQNGFQRRPQNGPQDSVQNGFPTGSENGFQRRPQNGPQDSVQSGFPTGSQNGFQRRPQIGPQDSVQSGLPTGFQNGFQRRPQNEFPRRPESGFPGRSQDGFNGGFHSPGGSQDLPSFGYDPDHHVHPPPPRHDHWHHDHPHHRF